MTVAPVQSIQPDQRNLTLHVRVLDLLVQCEAKVPLGDGTTYPAKVAEFLIGDSTGVVVLQVTGENISSITINETLEIHNIRTKMFKGFLRVISDPFLVTPLDTEIEGNFSYNASSIEYERV